MKSNKRMSLFSSGIILLLLFTTGCYYDQVYVAPPPPIEEDISFAVDVEPIFYTGNKCTACHPSTRGLDLSQGKAYASINDGRVDLANPNQSLIYTKPEPGGSHPQTYSIDEAAVVLKWIEDGAPNN